MSDWVKTGLEKNGFTEQPDGSWLRPALQEANQATESRTILNAIATHLFAEAIYTPYPVNAEFPRDYAAIAKACREKAEATVPFLLQELGLLPKEE